jgi:hypothetical protein
MLLRDDAQIALNEIHSLCIEAADHYALAATKTCVSSIKNQLLESVRQHHAFAARLATYIRQMDDQPRLPDPDKETVESFISNIKMKLVKDEKQALIQEQIKFEQKLIEAVRAGMQMNFSTDIKALLEQMLRYITGIQESLASLT